jgi:hypothetical protein
MRDWKKSCKKILMSLIEMHWKCKIIIHNYPIKNYEFILSYKKWDVVGWYDGKHGCLLLIDCGAYFFFSILIWLSPPI